MDENKNRCCDSKIVILKIKIDKRSVARFSPQQEQEHKGETPMFSCLQ